MLALSSSLSGNPHQQYFVLIATVLHCWSECKTNSFGTLWHCNCKQILPYLSWEKGGGLWLHHTQPPTPICTTCICVDCCWLTEWLETGNEFACVNRFQGSALGSPICGFKQGGLLKYSTLHETRGPPGIFYPPWNKGAPWNILPSMQQGVPWNILLHR